MNDTNDVTFIRDTKKISPKTKLSILIAVISAVTLVILGGYLGSFLSSNQSSEIVSVGLEGELPLDLTTNGYIYVSGYNEASGLNTYALNLNTGAFLEVTGMGNSWEFSIVDDSHALVSTALDGSVEKSTQIAIVDFSSDTYLNIETPVGFYKRHLSPFILNSDALVYSARKEPLQNDEFFDPLKWNIVYGEPESGQFTTLDNSFSPVLLTDRNEFMYLTSDGVNVYNYVTKENYIIDTGLININAGSEVAITNDYSKLILTAPNANSVIVFMMDVNEKISLTQIGVVQQTNRRYISPVVSPDNRFYATLAFSEISEQSDVSIEIRSFDSKEVVANYPVDVVDESSVRLNEWGSQLILDTAATHHEAGADHGGNETHN
jgi:hypothetical protein